MDDIYRMRQVFAALNAAGITWFVDHGTLLGLVREQRLLPWDHDIDLSIRLEDLEPCFQIIRGIKGNLNAHIVRTSRNLKILPYRGSGRQLDIGTYSCEENGMLEKTLVMYPRSEDLDWKKLRQFSWWQMRRMERLLRGVEIVLGQRQDKIPLFGKVHLQAFCAVVQAREALGVQFVSKVPQEYLNVLTSLMWRGLKINIPSTPERYLTYRYGEDWDVPKKKWVWWNNDKSISTD